MNEKTVKLIITVNFKLRKKPNPIEIIKKIGTIIYDSLSVYQINGIIGNIDNNRNGYNNSEKISEYIYITEKISVTVPIGIDITEILFKLNDELIQYSDYIDIDSYYDIPDYLLIDNKMIDNTELNEL